MKMVWLILLFSLLLSSTVNSQESVELLQLHDSTMAVQVETQHLKNVSNSILMAESWLRAHVLSHYPSTNITTIVVGHSFLCSKDQQHHFGLVLPSLKNIHHSLTRWGLQNHIKVAPSLSSDCLDSMPESYIKPLLTFLHEIASPYIITPLSDKASRSIETLRVISTNTLYANEKPSRRKLSVLPFPPRPTPATSPSHSPSRSSNPAFAVGSPLPPLIGTVTPPPESLPVAPTQPRSPPFLPNFAPMATPPYGPHLPPCEPSHGGAPVAGGHHGVWCVAKPSVPAETLQEALDFACGEGDADCEAIQEEGSCYYPDNVVAHASYAFNSYWQKTKKNGGTCGFGGTAMLINSDPSYAHCRFILT